MKNLISRPPPFDLANGIDKGKKSEQRVRMTRLGIVVMAVLMAVTTNLIWGQSGGGSGDNQASAGASLSWTAPGDDGNIGTASAYDLRYSTSLITALTFALADKAVNIPVPLLAGSTQGCFIDRLLPSRVYYFAIKAVDTAGNWSAISNVLIKPSQSYEVGDVNSDTRIDVADVIYLKNYIFNYGREPLPWGTGDTNCDGKISVGDLTYLINHIFQNGPVPGTNCP